MAITGVAHFNTISGINFVDISGVFSAVGDPLAHPARILKFLNTTDADMIVSLDGTTDHDYIPAGGFSLYDLTTNAGMDEHLAFRQGTQVYVQGVSAPTSGTFFVVSVYSGGAI